MKTVMGLIHHIDGAKNLDEITKKRCIATVPFGGRYCLVDFCLSNMVNAGMYNIGIITSFRFRSLLGHLGSGKDWGLDRKQDGLFILPSAESKETVNKRIVDLEDIYVNIDYLKRSQQEYVLIAGSNVVCNIELQDLYSYHLEKGADITIAYKEEKTGDSININESYLLETNKENRINSFSAKKSKSESVKLSLDMYLLKKELLLEILNNSLAAGSWDLVEILQERCHNLKIYGYSYSGYLAIIKSLTSYYQHQMDLLFPEKWVSLFMKGNPIFTRNLDGPPTKYQDKAEVKNSLIANACKIEGKVENSIIFRGVKIEKGAHVKNCIIMDYGQIQKEVFLDKVILDKGVLIRKGAMIKGDEYEPLVVEKGSVI